MGPTDTWGTPPCKVGAEDAVERREWTHPCGHGSHSPVQRQMLPRHQLPRHQHGTEWQRPEGLLEGKALWAKIRDPLTRG